MSYRIKKAEYVEGYKLKLYFDDGSIKIIDFEERLKTAKNLLIPLRKIEYFKKVKCDGYSIIWPNEVDFCPDVLYSIGKDVLPKTKNRRKSKKVSKAKNPSELKTRKRRKVRTGSSKMSSI